MNREESLRRAIALFEEAFRRQRAGRLEEAIALYRESIAEHPTAPAHTFLGWAYSMQERYEDAIAECKLAIGVDPDFGNPYNDIGSYLITLGRIDDAIPWLEKALEAPDYEPRHYPHCNLGRAWWAKGMLQRAAEAFEKALEIEPRYETAREALEALRRQLN